LESKNKKQQEKAMNLIPLFVALSALLYGVYVFLESRLESFYVFEPTQLHNFAKSAIAQHGNDTRAIVADIVANLQTTPAQPYVNLEQEWIFNNAGGAMGAMYVIHASKSKALPFETS
jgi:C-8 sterol isomerase